MKIDSKKLILIMIFLGIFSGCSALISDSMLKAIHQDIDINQDGYIDYNEYLINNNEKDMEMLKAEAKEKGMSVEEYQKWDFNRADRNRDGKVSSQELIDLARKEL